MKPPVAAAPPLNPSQDAEVVYDGTAAGMLASLVSQYECFTGVYEMPEVETPSGSSLTFYVLTTKPRPADLRATQAEIENRMNRNKMSGAPTCHVLFTDDDGEIPLSAKTRWTRRTEKPTNGKLETPDGRWVPAFYGPVIGIWGHAHSGKDTVFKMIAAARGHTQRFAFMDVFKRFLQKLYAFTDDQLWGDKKEEPDMRYPRGKCTTCNGTGRVGHIPDEVEKCPESGCVDGTLYLTPRYAMQTIGIEWATNCYSGTIFEYAQREINDAFCGIDVRRPGGDTGFSASHIIGRTRLAVIADLRAKTEIVRVAESGGGIIKITRPGAGLTGKAAEHATENQFDDEETNKYVGVRIVNDGSLDDLRVKVKEALEHFGV